MLGQVAHMLQVVKMEETPLVDAAPSEAMWAAIAASLDIDREQQASLMQHRHHFYSTLGTWLHCQDAAASHPSHVSIAPGSFVGEMVQGRLNHCQSGWTCINCRERYPVMPDELFSCDCI